MGMHIYQISSNYVFKICVFHFMHAIFQFKNYKRTILYVYKYICWYICILFSFQLYAY